jgi:LPS-assembly protein
MGRAGIAGLILAGLLALVPAEAPRGQDLPASLIADEVSYDRETRLLTASGNVEVLYQGRVLRARRIIYDEAADEIRAEGPLVLTDPAGGMLIADAAALTPDLTDGLITSARFLIAGQLQMAAVEVRRRDRYATLYRTVASSCTICPENPTPTWALRASRVTDDTVARRIYFENARFELFGVPIGYVPRLSIPEPGVERASGVLVPSLLSSGIFGLGFKLPYYRTLGPSADMTVTPFVTTEGGVLLEGEYRTRFADGGFDIAGVLAPANPLEDDQPLRGTLTAIGSIGLRYGFDADFDFAVASDNSFLAQYDYSDADRLTSTASINRTLTDEYVSLGTVAFQSLRDDEETDTVPFVFPEFTYRRLFGSTDRGGRFGLYGDSVGVLRDVGTNMVRAGGGVDWNREWLLPRGLLASTTGAALVDLYRVWDDPDEPDVDFRTVPTAAAELRWPLVRSTRSADHVIEPIAQVAWSEAYGEEGPNEDSQLPEFDETNLFSLNRFPGEDRVETGLRANLGVSYTRQAPSGWSLGATFGQVVRAEPDDEFWSGTGLTGRWSDYVGAVFLDFAPQGMTLVNRSLFNGADFLRNEFAFVYDRERAGLRAAYIYLAEDDSNPYLGPQPETNEFAFDARYRVHPNWELRGLWRYDVATSSNLRAGAAITYGNECAEFDLSVSRRYTSTTNLPAATSIGFNVRLAGIGEDGERDWPPRVCMAGGT